MPVAYYVYILQSEKDSTYYVGSTQDLESRLERHNQGRSKYTKGKGPWKIDIYGGTSRSVHGHEMRERDQGS
ncbi:MAG: GIY-YIG nuclease family protein [Deltaproteobacteria bacterium]|nr:GIY-YIG nuclease family protein [Deltaproteobacteria bacterium]